MTSIRSSVAVFCLVFLPSHAGAASYCVTNSIELQAALNTAASNGEPDHIKLASGSYPGSFSYFPDVAAGDASSIEISGGWVAFDPIFGECAFLSANPTAFATLLDGDGPASRPLAVRLLSGEATDLVIRRITFTGGDGTGALDKGAGLSVFAATSGTVLIEQCAFVANTTAATDGGAALWVRTGGVLRLRNSLFHGNHGRTTVLIDTAAPEDQAGVYVINNTFIQNTSEPGHDEPGALHLDTVPPHQSMVRNNNLWDNDGVDIRLTGPGTKWVLNNNFQSLSGTVHFGGDNMAVQPIYEPGLFNYTPAYGSPLIDAGSNEPTIGSPPFQFEDLWEVGTADVANRVRVQGPRPDLGAYEATPVLLFASGFEP